MLKTATGELAYQATAGTLNLLGQDGKVSAKIFYTAYTATDTSGSRPLTFAFNGGPGAASAYLHIGFVGPEIVDFGTKPDGATAVMKDNPESWLGFTDLVFIDPVGTGWSRAKTADAASNYYGVEQDAESLAKAITLYIQNNKRMGSPKYLLGESYGGFRAAKVASALKQSQGMLVSGIVMVSPLIDAGLIFDTDGDPVGAAVQLPSLIAANLERNGRFTPQAMQEAEEFAMTDYLVGLAGPVREGEAADAFYARIADLTGIDRKEIAGSGGFVGSLYSKSPEGAEGRIVSTYDAAYSAPDAYPESRFNRNDDPILDGYTRAYGALFVDYARNTLGYKCDMTYSLLNTDVNRKWSWGEGKGRGGRITADASIELRDLLSTIPSFRLLVMHGYSDAITPYGASRYVIDHMPPKLREGRTELTLYRGGHMFYTDAQSRAEANADAERFYKARISTD